MATKPTRLQQQACDKLAEALLLITEAARLDGGKLDREGLGVIVERVSRVSSAFALDDIVARALERRAKALGLPSDAGELLTLMESEIQPPAMLLLGDDDFKGLVERMREELGDV